MAARKISVGSDHAGFELRGRIVGHLRALGFEVEDLGTPSGESTDDPDWAAAVEAARLSRAHDDANVLCVGARLVPETTAFAIVDACLDTDFEGGRRARRVDKIAALEIEEA